MNGTATSELRAPRRNGTPLAVRLALFVGLIALAATAYYVLFKTPFGAKLQDRQFVLGWVREHRLVAPLLLVGIYALFAVLMLPVFELQVAAGYCFGLFTGVLWCEIGAVIGAVTSLLLSRWLVGQWFRERYESRIAKLRALDEKLGHNGLLVVMGVRLCHILAFGVSNYLFGLTRITIIDVFIGTLLGGIPAISAYVAIGVFGADVLKEGRLWIVLGIINLILLVPLALRYLKPGWFKKIGVE
jgi:uncharacterized membrane protein YdjX (TVP38/TMEM64 family)